LLPAFIPPQRAQLRPPAPNPPSRFRFFLSLHILLCLFAQQSLSAHIWGGSSEGRESSEGS